MGRKFREHLSTHGRVMKDVMWAVPQSKVRIMLDKEDLCFFPFRATNNGILKDVRVHFKIGDPESGAMKLCLYTEEPDPESDKEPTPKPCWDRWLHSSAPAEDDGSAYWDVSEMTHAVKAGETFYIGIVCAQTQHIWGLVDKKRVKNGYTSKHVKPIKFEHESTSYLDVLHVSALGNVADEPVITIHTLETIPLEEDHQNTIMLWPAHFESKRLAKEEDYHRGNPVPGARTPQPHTNAAPGFASLATQLTGYSRDLVSHFNSRHVPYENESTPLDAGLRHGENSLLDLDLGTEDPPEAIKGQDFAAQYQKMCKQIKAADPDAVLKFKKYIRYFNQSDRGNPVSFAAFLHSLGNMDFTLEMCTEVVPMIWPEQKRKAFIVEIQVTQQRLRHDMWRVQQQHLEKLPGNVIRRPNRLAHVDYAGHRESLSFAIPNTMDSINRKFPAIDILEGSKT